MVEQQNTLFQLEMRIIFVMQFLFYEGNRMNRKLYEPKEQAASCVSETMFRYFYFFSKYAFANFLYIPNTRAWYENIEHNLMNINMYVQIYIHKKTISFRSLINRCVYLIFNQFWIN